MCLKPRLVGEFGPFFFRLSCLGFDPLRIFRAFKVKKKEKKIAEVAKISSSLSSEQLP